MAFQRASLMPRCRCLSEMVWQAEGTSFELHRSATHPYPSTHPQAAQHPEPQHVASSTGDNAPLGNSSETGRVCRGHAAPREAVIPSHWPGSCLRRPPHALRTPSAPWWWAAQALLVNFHWPDPLIPAGAAWSSSSCPDVHLHKGHASGWQSQLTPVSRWQCHK